jgi:hypothetical protein
MRTRLREISYRLPRSAGAFVGGLTSLLADATGVTVTAERILLTPPYPSDAVPVTSLVLADVSGPEIVFTPGPAIGLTVSSLRLHGANAGAADVEGSPDVEDVSAVEDITDVEGTGVDGGAETHRGDEAPPPVLPLDEVVGRLGGHILGVDHTGVNLPTVDLSRPSWDRLLGELAAVANLYRYPTGEDWPFVVPADAVEFGEDIRVFEAAREPKFELVYDGWVSRPLWQFALRTDLPRPELETLLPAPYGTVLAGLEDVFRVVRVPPPCSGLDIRLDLYYHDEGSGADWVSGAWLVTEGGRVRPRSAGAPVRTPELSQDGPQ